MGFDPDTTDLWSYARHLQLVKVVFGAAARIVVLNRNELLFGTTAERQLLETQPDAAGDCSLMTATTKVSALIGHWLSFGLREPSCGFVIECYSFSSILCALVLE